MKIERTCNIRSCLHCERRRNYQINGGVCDVWGDPHYTTWNWMKHDFQGDIDKLQYYYIHPCNGYSFNKLPFAMIGSHYSYGGRTVTGLDYITLVLFDNDGEDNISEYYIFISTYFQKYILENENSISTNYDININNNKQLIELTSSATNPTPIGNRFEII